MHTSCASMDLVFLRQASSVSRERSRVEGRVMRARNRNATLTSEAYADPEYVDFCQNARTNHVENFHSMEIEYLKSVKMAMVTCWYENISVGNYAYNLVRALQKAGKVNLKIITSACICSRLCLKKNKFTHKDFRFISFPYLFSLETNQKWLSPLFDLVLFVLQFLRGLNYLRECKHHDLIHYQQSSSYSFGIVPLLPLLSIPLSKRLIVTIHSLDKVNFRFRFINRLYNNADCIIVHSLSMKETALQMGIRNSKIQIVPHGTLIPKLYEFERNEVTFFGEPVKRKGMPLILDALKILKDKNVKMLIHIYGIYSETEKRSTVATARQLGVEDRLIWGGRLSEEDFDKKMQESIFTLVVYPYSISGSSILTRAMSNATPVIASNIGGNPEYLPIESVLVPPHDPKCLAESMIRLLRNELLRKRLGDESRSQVQKLFSWDIVAGKTLHIYFDVLKHSLENNKKRTRARTAST